MTATERLHRSLDDAVTAEKCRRDVISLQAPDGRSGGSRPGSQRPTHRDQQAAEHQRAAVERRADDSVDHSGLLTPIRGGATHGLRLQRKRALDDDAVAGLDA